MTGGLIMIALPTKGCPNHNPSPWLGMAYVFPAFPSALSSCRWLGDAWLSPIIFNPQKPSRRLLQIRVRSHWNSLHIASAVLCQFKKDQQWLWLGIMPCLLVESHLFEGSISAMWYHVDYVWMYVYIYMYTKLQYIIYTIPSKIMKPKLYSMVLYDLRIKGPNEIRWFSS